MHAQARPALAARLGANTAARLAILAVGALVLLILLQTAALTLKQRVPGPASAGAVLAVQLAGSLIMIAAYGGAVRLLERRAATETACAGSLRLLLPGMLFGAALFALVYAILWACGIAHLTGFGTTAGLLGIFGVSVASGVQEEIVFRAALFRVIDERFGTTAAMIVSAAVFGGLHGLNRGATLTSTAAVALEAGILLAAAFAMVRSLWLPIGMHFAWNFTEGGIFGAAVSGGRSQGLLAFPLTGPTLYTGGVFGPEASIVAVIVCLAAAGILIGVTLHRGHWRAFRLRPQRSPSRS